MLKKYLLLIIVAISIFGCNESKVSYDGVLIKGADVPFSVDEPNSIYLKTTVSDEQFPDSVRYYYVIPKDKYYQNFQNNIGNKVSVEGIEEHLYKATIYYDIDIGDIPDNSEPSKPHVSEIYRL